MRRLFPAVLKRVWVVSTILGGTAFGAFHGWQRHAVVGAIALGFVAGAFLASSPRLLVELLTWTIADGIGTPSPAMPRRTSHRAAPGRSRHRRNGQPVTSSVTVTYLQTGTIGDVLSKN